MRMHIHRLMQCLKSIRSNAFKLSATLALRRRMKVAEAQISIEARTEAVIRRARYLARNARLQREGEARDARRTLHVSGSVKTLPSTVPISKADVLAAIARGRAKREARLLVTRDCNKDAK